VVADGEARVIDWINKEDERLHYRNLVNAGIHVLSAELLERYPRTKTRVDLDRDVLKPALRSRRVFAYVTPEYVRDMGTPERFARVGEDIENGVVAGRNLGLPQRAVFIDRDGTVNEFASDYVRSPDEFALIDGAAEAIGIVNRMGFLAIVVTNQPIIARGEVDFGTLDAIHGKMETELGKGGAYLDDVFFCPHHPDGGFPGERPEFKIDCDCRKPKPGMILRAAEKYNVDLSRSYMVGDDRRDAMAGINSGCTPALLSPQTMDGVMGFDSLLGFARWLRAREGARA
jgi:D,D-heptose 1,7-bisphosphate phosphatase